MEIYHDGSTLVLVGPLDTRSVAQTRRAVYDLLAVHADGISIDLSEVPWVDAAALNMLAMAAHHADAERRHLRLRGCSRHLRRVLSRSRLRALLEIEDTGSRTG